jgi:hypothetical protein
MFTFIESSIFAKYLPDYLPDDEYAGSHLKEVEGGF